jgi:4-hydroxybenzoate polyprenyltransferase
LAGFLNLCREIVKDAEDMEGDRQKNAKTIPLTFGLKFSNRIVYFILLFTISFVAISLYYQKQYFKAPVNYIYWAYYFLFVIVPLYRLAVRIRFDEDATDYSEHSKVLKYDLYTGILSILFF